MIKKGGPLYGRGGTKTWPKWNKNMASLVQFSGCIQIESIISILMQKIKSDPSPIKPNNDILK